MSATAFDRRAFLRTATAGTALASMIAVSPTTARAAQASRTARPDGRVSVTARWLGTAGWRMDLGAATLLVDPYLSRFSTGLFTGRFDPTTKLTVEEATVDQHAGTPSVILVSHTHWDHFNDVPHIATATKARIVGTLTAYNLALALGVEAAQLSPVKGGEALDFGDYVVEVVSSLHSRNANFSMAFPGVRLERPAVPATVAELPEGDTLAFQVTAKQGPSVFFMGASDFVARNLTGLAPDVAMIAVPSTLATFDYVPRIMEALDRPGTVVPVHWDNFERPLVNPPTPDRAAKTDVESFANAVRKVSPQTRVIIPEYLTPYTFG